MTEHTFDAHEEHVPHTDDASLPLEATHEADERRPETSRPEASGSRQRAPRKRAPKPGHDEPAQERVPATTVEDILAALEAQGFTPDEAARLIDISDRLANSREVREGEAVMRRLRFHRWLVERGLLDEFSA
ncbi:MAG: hypothetical protein IVW57_01105 [Ktedonobacterales bacterium]|nr:hypothetical protein [Ktedonobacterales bacterium]